ncbi:unnamed protein product [Pneumocystis jirovecii]|uniref:Trafficking protein particle complex II-specific subunit 65 IgD3 domain-containing protein n=1 Tax=Pneumocystis jirovecii TaxID=42068 RepID=L0PE83_PNEJI|nr:unnamed protein product [Pneumocystis jirovecii]
MIKEIGFFFVKSSLDVVVLQNVTLQAGVKAILNAPRRQLLFHDEIARVFIILICQNENLNKEHVKWAPYLSCTIDGWMDDFQRYTSQVFHEEERNRKERMNDGSNFFFRVISSKKMISEFIEEKMTVIWEVEIFIPFPRLRVTAPKVQLIASITVKPEVLVMSQDGGCEGNDDISTNILESLSCETMVYGVTPFLSLSRISNVSLMSDIEPSSSIETLRKVVKKVFACGSVISLRTRSSMVMVPSFQRILLSVDIESCSANQLPVLIENIEIKVKGRVAQRIENGAEFPIILAFQEQFLVLYYIPFDPSIDQGITDLLALPVTIFVKMKPQIFDGEYSLLVMSQWYTTIHVSKDQTRVSRYQSVIQTEDSVPDSNSLLQKHFVHGNNYSLLRSKSPEPSDIKSPFWKISLTFTAPKCVKIWKVFEIEIVLVNQSNVSKDISLSVLSKTQDVDYGALPSVMENDSLFILEEKAVHALHKQISVEHVHILPLTNDIRILPLNSYGCYFSSISFIAIREGLFSLEGIRVTDLHTGSYIDCCSLPRIFVYS